MNVKVKGFVRRARSLFVTLLVPGLLLAATKAALSVTPAPETTTTRSIVTETPDPPTSTHEHAHPPVALAPDAASIVGPKDTVPDFAAVPSVTSAKSGPWTDPATWGGRRPHSLDIVRIAPGHVVTLTDVAEVAVLGINGTLTFATARHTRLKAETVLVYRGGRLIVGTPAAPVAALAEIVFTDRPLDPVRDPLQFGVGLIAFGEVTMHGIARAAAWTRLAQEPKAVDTSLVISGPRPGWMVGDRLVLPDTRHIPLAYQASTQPPRPVPLEIDEVNIASISGHTIALAAPLRFDHKAGRNSKGSVVALPHVANLTRNIVVRSENPAGTRGHVMFTERARVDIRYTAFENLGRTTAEPLGPENQIGRYPVHFHHLMGPKNPANTGYQFVFQGNSVVGSRKWAVAIHNSHWGLVRDNVIYGAEGAAIVTEQGNERENVIEKNFAIRIGTTANTPFRPTYGGVGGPGRPLGFGDFAWEGSGYWFNGNDNYVRDNVAANAAYAGITYNGRSPSSFSFNHPLVPKFRGADLAAAEEWDNYAMPVRRAAPPVRESVRNEVYASSVGAWVGFAGRVGTLKDYLLWNIRQDGLYAGRNASVTFENFTILADQQASNSNGGLAGILIINRGMNFGATIYTSGAITVRNANVEGFNIGLLLPANTTSVNPRLFPDPSPITAIDGIALRNYVNIVEYSPIAPKTTVIRNLKMALNAGPANRSLSPVPMHIISMLAPNVSISNQSALSRTFIYNYEGKNLEYFFPEQAPQFLMPTSVNNAFNCPTAGLTNRKCLDKHRVTTMGRIATCTGNAGIPQIEGFACPFTDPPVAHFKPVFERE